ncbi:MAG: SUMF1/EgtB/PvdO family nonheme iron enzyme [Chitinispirillales bacterium]|jgi:formylglycine-generating enzyme required for sulfatase activity|nr:SUMF1/EgtB/PvdO family nonheme iron enzyme [Chitinispirillales bacterium]
MKTVTKVSRKTIVFYAVIPTLLLLFTACSDFIERSITVPYLTLFFDTQGGDERDPLTAAYGEKITLPQARYGGYALAGWYSEDGVIKYGDPGYEYTITDNTVMFARWSEVLPKDLADTLVHGTAFVLVEAGTFTMGSPESEAGRHHDETQREVTITRDFWISKYPVTNRLFGRSVANDLLDHPVVDVTWEEAQSFAKSNGWSLPTEAQWEFAARGGNKSNGYLYSGSDALDGVAWYLGNSNNDGAQRVGQKQPNELGIRDMSGNVFEWVYDFYGMPDPDDLVDPRGPETGNYRISRGGSWQSPQRECRVADRPFSYPGAKSDYKGFRVVFEVVN